MTYKKRNAFLRRANEEYRLFKSIAKKSVQNDINGNATAFILSHPLKLGRLSMIKKRLFTSQTSE